MLSAVKTFLSKHCNERVRIHSYTTSPRKAKIKDEQFVAATKRKAPVTNWLAYYRNILYLAILRIIKITEQMSSYLF